MSLSVCTHFPYFSFWWRAQIGYYDLTVFRADRLDNCDHKGLCDPSQDIPDPGDGDREPYICLRTKSLRFGWCLGARVGCSHGVPTSHLPVCYFAFSLVGANFFLSLGLVFVFLTVMDTVGRMTSSPLDVLFTPCVDVNIRARKLSVLMKKSKLVIFCRLGWPAFDVGWSPGGSFDLAIIRAEEEIVFRPWLGHPNQVPNKVIWRDLVEDSPFLDEIILAPAG